MIRRLSLLKESRISISLKEILREKNITACQILQQSTIMSLRSLLLNIPTLADLQIDRNTHPLSPLHNQHPKECGAISENDIRLKAVCRYLGKTKAKVTAAQAQVPNYKRILTPPENTSSSQKVITRASFRTVAISMPTRHTAS